MFDVGVLMMTVNFNRLNSIQTRFVSGGGVAMALFTKWVRYNARISATTVRRLTCFFIAKQLTKINDGDRRLRLLVVCFIFDIDVT